MKHIGQILILKMVVVCLGMWFSGCSSPKVDKTEPFAMAMNGKPYKIKLGTPKGFIREVEVGYSESHIFSVSFPTKALSQYGERGFRLQFDTTFERSMF